MLFSMYWARPRMHEMKRVKPRVNERKRVKLRMHEMKRVNLAHSRATARLQMVIPEEYHPTEKVKKVTNGGKLDVGNVVLGLRKFVCCPQQLIDMPVKGQLTDPTVKVNGCRKNTVE